MPSQTLQPNRSFLALITIDIQDRALDLCHEAQQARERSRAQRQRSQQARHEREALRIEQRLCRDHDDYLRAMGSQG